MLSRFDTIPACHGQTGSRTDGRTELLGPYINIARQFFKVIVTVTRYICFIVM